MNRKASIGETLNWSVAMILIFIIISLYLIGAAILGKSPDLDKSSLLISNEKSQNNFLLLDFIEEGSQYNGEFVSNVDLIRSIFRADIDQSKSLEFDRRFKGYLERNNRAYGYSYIIISYEFENNEFVSLVSGGLSEIDMKGVEEIEDGIFIARQDISTNINLPSNDRIINIKFYSTPLK